MHAQTLLECRLFLDAQGFALKLLSLRAQLPSDGSSHAKLATGNSLESPKFIGPCTGAFGMSTKMNSSTMQTVQLLAILSRPLPHLDRRDSSTKEIGFLSDASIYRYSSVATLRLNLILCVVNCCKSTQGIPFRLPSARFPPGKRCTILSLPLDHATSEKRTKKMHR